MDFDISKLQWIRQPAHCVISNEKIEIITQPHTDLWQRTYYHFGIYACSPEDSTFKAQFTDMRVTPCQWLAHDGQQPDEE